MAGDEKYEVAIFESVYHVLRGEKIMKEQGLEYKIIPVPRQFSSDCGVCLRFPSRLQEAVIAALLGKVEILELRAL